MKQHQLLAFRNDVRKRTQAEMTELNRTSKIEALTRGVAKHYQPAEEGGMRYPDERSPVAVRFGESLERFREAWAEEAELLERMDRANLRALADIIVDGEVLATGVPATQLLYLEKHLEHLRTFLTSFTELPPGQQWTYSEAAGLFQSDVAVTQRTEKQQIPLVLYPHSDKHPAQTQIIVKDTVVGHWHTTVYSGAIEPNHKRMLLARLAKLSDAVAEARERANEVEVPEKTAHAGNMLAYVFDRE